MIEATGDAGALDHVVHRARAGASLLLLGLPYGPRQLSFERIVAYDLAVVGSVGSGAADFRSALEQLPRLDVAALTSTVVPLEDYREAW